MSSRFARTMVRSWAVLALSLAGCMGAAAGASASQGAEAEHVCAAPAPGYASCFAMVRRITPEPGSRRAGGAADAVGVRPAGGLTPRELAGAYGYDPELGGSGQTIAIVDAYDDPDIASDLSVFDSEYGIDECSGCFTKVGQTGSPTALPSTDESAWSIEISLDVEAARSACWNCRIVLVEADSPSFADLTVAENTAVALGATEVSNSYGGPESRYAPAESAYDHPGVVITAATGDFGWGEWTYYNEKHALPMPARPNIPASLPTVVAVGGTTLDLGPNGERSAETVWNGDGPLDALGATEQGATGGGCSTLFEAQPWQRDAAGYAAAGCGGTRLDADVAAVADPDTGFDIYDSYECGAPCERFRNGSSWLEIGGTSLSTPLVAGMYALAGGSHGVSYPALTLYGHLGGSSVFDVTQGGNGYCDDGGVACGIDGKLAELARLKPELLGVSLDCEGTTACNASPGLDGPTGIGAPTSLSLFEPLSPSAAIAAPASVVAGAAAGFGAGGSADPYPGGLDGASYEWAFGDGSSATGTSPAHVYSAPGPYAVTLTMTDAYGLTSTTTSDVTVAPAPAAGGVAVFKRVSVPDAKLAAVVLQAAQNGAFTVRISCPRGESRCEGTVSVRTAMAIAASAHRRVMTLASARFRVAGGKVVAVRLRLSSAGRALLARRRSLKVKVRIVSRDPSGASHTTIAIATLRAPRRR